MSYIEPTVSYFDGIGDAGKTVSIAFPAAVSLALVAALATSARGSENTLERRGNV
jgi:hypothetical protein